MVGSQSGSGNRWQGYSHQELYDMLHSGPGGGAAGTAADQWSGLSSALADIQQDISSGISNSGASWVGAAADSAYDALGPLGDWAEQASTAAEVMRVSAELQGNLLGKARADMPAPVPVDAEAPHGYSSLISQIFGGQLDYEIQEAAANAAEQRAYQVMAAYESGTSDNTATLGDFGQPPNLVVDTHPITAAAARARVRVPEEESHPIPRARTEEPALRRVTEEPEPESRTAPRTAPTTTRSAEPAEPTEQSSTGQSSSGTTTEPEPAEPTVAPASPTTSTAPPVAGRPTKPRAGTEAPTSEKPAPREPAPGKPVSGRPAQPNTTVDSGTSARSAKPKRESAPAAPSDTPAGGPVVAPRSGQAAEDEVIDNPGYLVQADDVFGYSSVRNLVSPPVIGDAE